MWRIEIVLTCATCDAGAKGSTFSFMNRGTSDEVLVKTRSASPAHRNISPSFSYTIFASGNSVCRSRTLCSDRFTMTIRVHPFEIKCFTSSFDIFPAPTINTFTRETPPTGSFMTANSTAAELTETAPAEMLVSVLTRFPAVMACLNKPVRLRPKPETSCPTLRTCLTCTVYKEPGQQRVNCFSCIGKGLSMNSKFILCKTIQVV